MLDPRVLDTVASIVGPDDFHSESHAVIFGRLVDMSQKNRRIDEALLLDRMRTTGDLERVGGTAYLVEIFGSVASPRHFRDYAEIVRRDSQKRRIIRAGIDAVAAAYDTSTTPEDVLGALEVNLANIKTGQYDADPVTMEAACVEAIGEIDEIIRRGHGAGTMTGLPAFDEQIGGLFPGELTVIAARPSQGKTSLALQMAAHAAARGHAVYFATLEMGRSELALKRLCAVSGVSGMRIRTGAITTCEKSRIMEAAQSVAVQNFHLHDWPEIRPFDIARAARRLQAGIVFADYLQIVTPPDATKKRYEQVGDISKQLKVVARQMNIPVVACCQINRQAEQAKEARPMLSQLRESGNIEQDADVVLLLWRPRDGIRGGTESKFAGEAWDADLIVAKNRKGVTPNIRLQWDGDATTFSCYATASQPNRNGPWNPDAAFV
jgi:replicative DNA helicase